MTTEMELNSALSRVYLRFSGKKPVAELSPHCHLG